MLCHLLSFLLPFFFLLLLTVLAAVALIYLFAAILLALGFLFGPEGAAWVVWICDDDFFMALSRLAQHQPVINLRPVLKLLLFNFRIPLGVLSRVTLVRQEQLLLGS